MGLEVLADWALVQQMALDEKMDLEDISMFSADLLCRAEIKPGADTDEYSLTIGTETFSHTRGVGETEAGIAQILIDQINLSKALYRQVEAMINQDFDDWIEVFALGYQQSFVLASSGFVNVTENVGGILEPGARTLVLEEAARKAPPSIWGTGPAKVAQAAYAAHMACQIKNDVTMRGPIASTGIGAETVSYTIPKLNPKTDQELYMTYPGSKYMEIRREVIIPMYGR